MACATLKRRYDFDPLHSPTGSAPKQRRCSPISLASTPPRGHQMNPSPFGDLSQRFNSDEISANIRDEVKHMQHRRKQLCFSLQESLPQIGGSPLPSTSEGCSTLGPIPQPVLSEVIGTVIAPNVQPDEPLFTYRQVGLICEHLMRERENQIREEYDKILASKLAEQYESFVKFTYDQIQKKFEGITPSYLS